jgi:hypothetical protein
LREKESFKKYNKIVYAYRLYYKPAFFVTQDEQNKDVMFVVKFKVKNAIKKILKQPKFIEGF